MKDPVVPLERKSVRSSFGRTAMGTAIRESFIKIRLGKSTKWRMLIR